MEGQLEVVAPDRSGHQAAVARRHQAGGGAPGERFLVHRPVVEDAQRGHVPERRAGGDPERVEPIAQVVARCLDELPPRLPLEPLEGVAVVADGGGREVAPVQVASELLHVGARSLGHVGPPS